MKRGKRIQARAATSEDSSLPASSEATIACEGCLQTLPERHFTTRSYQLVPTLGGLWCATCVQRERLGLKPRAPTFQKNGANVSYAIRNYKGEANAHWLVYFVVAGFLDNEINDPTIRELSALTTLPTGTVLRAIEALVRERYLIVDWAAQPDLVNVYGLNRKE